MRVPFDKDMVAEVLHGMRITNVGDATIRQTVAIAEELERRTGEKFIHLEMGSPGLPANHIGIDAQKAALDKGVASAYPNISGITPLKEQASRFIKAFLNVDVNPEGCVPTVGSMMGTFASFITCTHLSPEKDTILFIDPGFSVQPLQAKVLGYKRESFDVYDCRGTRLRDKLEGILSRGHIAAIIYSNPNNPSWVCLTEEELSYIGALATKYDTIVIEDLAYLGMDFRKDLGHPFQPPYVATVARYTENYILMLSASKIFSYAGERIATVAISNTLYNRVYPALSTEFGIDTLGRFFIFMVVYTMSSGVSAAPRRRRLRSAFSSSSGSVRPETSSSAKRGEPPARARRRSASSTPFVWSQASASSFEGSVRRKSRERLRIVGSTASSSSVTRRKVHSDGGSSIDLSNAAAASARTISAG